MDVLKHLMRFHVAAQSHPHVHESVVALKPPWLTLDNPRDGTPARTCRKSNDGAIKIIAPIANI